MRQEYQGFQASVWLHSGTLSHRRKKKKQNKAQPDHCHLSMTFVCGGGYVLLFYLFIGSFYLELWSLWTPLTTYKVREGLVRWFRDDSSLFPSTLLDSSQAPLTSASGGLWVGRALDLTCTYMLRINTHIYKSYRGKLASLEHDMISQNCICKFDFENCLDKHHQYLLGCEGEKDSV